MKVMGEFKKITIAIMVILLSTIIVILYASNEGERGQRLIAESRLAEALVMNTNIGNSLKAKERQFNEFVQKLQEKEAQSIQFSSAINVLQDKLALAMKEKEELAAALKQGNNKNETLALEKIVIKQLPSHEGRILKVNPDYSFVIVDIGAKEHLSAGDILSVYRDNEFIGRLVIEKVQEGYSAASILPRWRNAQIKENDTVREL